MCVYVCIIIEPVYVYDLMTEGAKFLGQWNERFFGATWNIIRGKS